MPWDLSLAPLNEAIRLEPDLAPAHVFLGKVEMSRGLSQRAEKRFPRAIEADPDDVEAYQELASALLQLGQIEDAAVAFQRALDLGPRGEDEGTVLNGLARIEMERGRLGEAGRRLAAAEESNRSAPRSMRTKGSSGGCEATRWERSHRWPRRSVALLITLPSIATSRRRSSPQVRVAM